MSKPKPVNWSLISQEDDEYTMLSEILRLYHGDLTELGVSIVLMWRTGWKIDADKYLVLADISKTADKYRELREHDFIIGLNRDSWGMIDEQQRIAVMDTQVSRIAISTNRDGDPKEDDRSRYIFRLKREQSLNQELLMARHGMTQDDVVDFVVSRIDEVLEKTNEGQGKTNEGQKIQESHDEISQQDVESLEESLND